MAAIFDDCIIITDAESCKEQNGGKQFLVGQTTAKLQAVYQLHLTKKRGKKAKPNILTLLDRQLSL